MDPLDSRCGDGGRHGSPPRRRRRRTRRCGRGGHAERGRLTDLVNPFIGTENEGNTYPGAAVPFGMVQFSPDTGHNTGYDYSETHIRGFSTVHISGVGCGLGGDLPVLPTTGDITSTDNAAYAAEFSHDDEKAAPARTRWD